MEASEIKKNGNQALSGSFRNAFAGIATLLKLERNAKIHLVILVLVIAAGILLKISAANWIAVSLAAGFVIAAEAFNTAIEALCDAVKPEFDPGIRKAKDLAAAGVLISAIVSVVTGLIVFVPALIRILS
ncbi:MAG: diacylglycerol kinase family protein [Bacteroidota bacterium]